MTTLLKFIHLAAISIWSAGLIALPFLFRQRVLAGSRMDFDRLHRMTRFVYVAMTSPAAVIAIGSGTALIFFQATFQEWFSIKMALVAIMVMLHVAAGVTLPRVFLPGGSFGSFPYATWSGAYVVVITAIICVALAKPHIDANQFAIALFSPGGLRHVLVETKMPTP